MTNETNETNETNDELKSGDELETLRQIVSDDDEVLFDKYINKPKYGSKFWLYIALGAVFLLMVFIYKYAVLDNFIAPEELKASLEIFDIDSQWVVKEEVHEKDFEGIVLVPQISFRFRNVGEEKLKYVSVLGVFRLQNRSKALGEGNRMTLRKGLEPDKGSDRIVVNSSFGYRATSKEAFAKNNKEWKNASVDIYVKSGSSSMIFLKKLYIIRRIDGLEMDIEIKVT